MSFVLICLIWQIVSFTLDDTWCEPGWYGRSGICYRAVLISKSFDDAIETCHQYGAVLISPVDRNFISQFLTIPSLKPHKFWWTAIVDQFGNEKYLHANGSRFIATDSYFVNIFNDVNSFGKWHFMMLVNDSTKLSTTYDKTSTKTFMCQKSAGIFYWVILVIHIMFVIP